jgi:hypothetical protein
MNRTLYVAVFTLLVSFSSNAHAQQWVGDGRPTMTYSSITGGLSYQSTCPGTSVALAMWNGPRASGYIGGITLFCGYPELNGQYVSAQTDRAYWVFLGQYTYTSRSSVNLSYSCRQGDAIIAVQHDVPTETWGGTAYGLCAPVITFPSAYSLAQVESRGYVFSVADGTPYSGSSDGGYASTYCGASAGAAFISAMSCSSITPIPFTGVGICKTFSFLATCPTLVK